LGKRTQIKITRARKLGASLENRAGEEIEETKLPQAPRLYDEKLPYILTRWCRTITRPTTSRLAGVKQGVESAHGMNCATSPSHTAMAERDCQYIPPRQMPDAEACRVSQSRRVVPAGKLANRTWGFSLAMAKEGHFPLRGKDPGKE